MILLLECIIFCFLMGLICFLGTGNDDKNIKSFRNYSDELKGLLRNNDKYKDKIKEANPIVVFVSNLVLFLIIEFIFGLFIRTDNFLYNFVALLILGQVANIFDLVIMDLLWFRNTSRVRFSEYSDDKYYKYMKGHINSFLKALLMFTLVALIDGSILMLF